MKTKHKKITTAFLGLALLFFASSFCLDSLMLAPKAHAADEVTFQQMYETHRQTGGQVDFMGHANDSDHVLPCCSERKSNAATIETGKLEGKTVITLMSATDLDLQKLETSQADTKFDSLTAPPEEGLLASIIKKE